MNRAVVFLLISTVYIASAVPVQQSEHTENYSYSRYIQFPDGAGNMHDVDLEAEPDMELLNEIAKSPALYNQYFLYTRNNPTTPQSLILNVDNTIWHSNFNPHVPTVAIVHGWLSNQNSDINPIIRNALLASSDVNVIVLDWSRLAIGGYVTAVNGVPATGRALGQFLAYVSTLTGARVDTMHLVGFSLGAHVVGNAGRTLGGKAGRITGLDPAGPLWNFNSNCLNPNDGVYVEAIHTDGGYTFGGLGIGSAVADVDFFVNGGISQPACLTNICNHNRAWELFAASVTFNHLIGNLCSNSLQITFDNCKGVELHMGNDHPFKFGTPGKYRVNTARRYPF